MKSRTAVLVAGVSDVSVGYGSPQVTVFMQSVLEHYNGVAVLFEPDEPERVGPARRVVDDVEIQRVATAFHPHAHPAGRVEYIIATAQRLNALRPDVLILFCTYSLPVVFRLRRRPRMVIYYALESVPAYGELDVEMNRHLVGLVDLIIFPEENRAIRDTGRCRYDGIPKVIVYNCALGAVDRPPLQALDRNGYIGYFGQIHRELTCAEYFTRAELSDVPIHLYGRVNGWSDSAEFVRALRGKIRYRGHWDAGSLREERRRFAYSLVFWNPKDENRLFAAPNKFFESLADGVPPIAAPHPQCKMLIDRYECGLVMNSWDFDSFQEAIRWAMRQYGTEEYAAMVQGCRRAVEREANWDTQFAKVRPWLRQVR